ncbi:MAG: T9SS type A sorting domain-containing protein [Bacteroidales bacterium]|nr:T9SS type A sorting domain-containing protein [Bacteroidales bacterium]
MKKINTVFFLLLVSFAFISNQIKADIVYTSTPDSTASVGESYSYQVTVSHDGTNLQFSLVEKPAGMTIGQTSGLISWTPAAIDQGGIVVVKATNSTTPEGKLQTYFIYLSDAIECPQGLTSYWKLDEAEGPVYHDYVSGHDAYHGGSAFTLYDTISDVVDNCQVFKPAGDEDQFLTVNEVEDFNWSEEDTFAISLWFKWTGEKHGNDNQMLVGRGDGNRFIVLGIRYYDPETLLPVPNQLIFTMNDGNGHSYMVTSWDGIHELDTEWHHAVAEFIGKPNGQAQQLNLYYDKVNVGGDTEYFDSFEMDTTNKLGIGYWDAYGIQNRSPFTGKMDEILIYNKALGQSGVNSIYNDGIAHKPHCKPGNYAPVITSTPPDTINEDIPLSYTLTYRELDATDVVTKSVKIIPSWMSFSPATGELSGMPLNSHVGDTVVSLAINDGHVEIVQTFTLTVKNTNDPPVKTSTAPTTVNEDVMYTYTFTAEDEDIGDQLTLSIQGTLPSWLNFVDNGDGSGVLSGTPTNDAVGTDPFRNYTVVIRATDKASAYVQENFTIRVNNINDAPVITGQVAVSTDEDVALLISLDHLVVTDVDDVYPTDFTLNVQNGLHYTRSGNTITPELNYSGELTVPLSISDGDSIKNYNLTVTVNPVNDPPVFQSTPVVTAKERLPYSYTFIATDVDDATLSYDYDKKPVWISFTSSAAGGSIFGTPGNTDVGTDSVVIKVTDSKATTYQKFTITVTNENDPPSFTSIPVTTGDDYELYVYKLLAEDLDAGDVLTFFGEIMPSWLNIVTENDTARLKGTPLYNQTGDNPVKIGVTDSYDTTYQSFTIVVGNNNTLPVVVSDPDDSVEVNQPYAYQLVVTDVDEDDEITITPTTIPQWLNYDPGTKILSGLPDNSVSYLNNVVFTIGDGRGEITHSFTIKVKGVNSLNDYSMSNALVKNLYPVPVRDEMTIELADSQPCIFQLIDLNGKVLRNIDLLDQNRISVDVSDLYPNVYIFKVIKGTELQVGKIIVE